MKSLVKANAEAGLWLQDVAEPELGPNVYKWDDWAARTIPVGMTVGHEFMGRVVDMGSEVKGLEIGDRVSAEGHITCGHCRNCRAGQRHICRNTVGIGVNRTGAFAELISVPAVNVYPMPDDIPDEIGALFDPLGNAIHTALAQDLVGEDVLITGAGPIGAMAAAVAKHVGARHVVVTDINDYRLKLAADLGATRTVNVSDEKLEDVMAELGMKEGFDVGLEMSGAGEALRSMLTMMNHGGKVAILGLIPNGEGINWDDVIFKGLEVRGIYGRRMFETWYKMISMLQSGLDVSGVITHQMPYTEFEAGFDTIFKGESGKVILDWN